MGGGYSNVAPFYDKLSQLIYGKALIRSQVYLLPFIPANAHVLIVGGGTGWILEEISKIHPQGLTITYVEVAGKMLNLSCERDIAKNNVTFINNTVEDVKDLSAVDVIITSFLFDNFLPATVTRVFEHLHQLLKPGGIWLNTDFQLTGKWWQNMLLKSMLLFFRMLCGIESKQLPDMTMHFNHYNYTILSQKTFFGEFIKATAYQKKI